MLLLLLQASTDEPFDPAQGTPFIMRNAIAIPVKWFRGYNTGGNAVLVELERVYILDFSTTAGKKFDMQIPMETQYWMNASIEQPLTFLNNSIDYFILKPAAQFRHYFADAVQQYHEKQSDDQYTVILSYFYMPTTGFSILADFADIEWQYLFYFEFSRRYVIFKMQEFSYVHLVNEGKPNVALPETYPILECFLHDKTFYPYPQSVVFEQWPEKNSYGAYMNLEGMWAFKPRTAIPGDIQQRVNSGNLIFTQCNLFLCKNEAASVDNGFYSCARYLPPAVGISVDYQLPNETVPASILAGFVVLCIIFAAVFVAFLYLSIMTQRARARRVTDKNKNKVQAKEGGGKGGRKGDEK